MRHAMIAAAVAASLSAALVGCKDEKTAAPPAPATPATQPAAAPAPAGTSGLPAMPAGVNDAVAKYSEYSKQLTDAIQSNKWDDAEAAMKKIEEIKSKLPASAQGGVDSLRKMLDTQKALQGSLPVVPPATTTPPVTVPPVTVPPVTTPPATTTPPAAPAAGDPSAEASEHMRSAGMAIGQQKWDEATKHLDQFDAMKDKIPEGKRKFMEESAAVLRKSIEQGKSGGLPGAAGALLGGSTTRPSK